MLQLITQAVVDQAIDINAFHRSHWYDDYFYAHKRLSQTVHFMDNLTKGQQDLTFIELFSHIGIISRAILLETPQFTRADLYELEEDIIEKGASFADLLKLNMHFYAQDLGICMADIQPQNAVIYVGEESHELLHSREQLKALAYNCAAMCAPGSQLVFKWNSFKERHDIIRCSNTHEPLESETIDVPDSPDAFTAQYYVTAFDPLTNVVNYRFSFTGNGYKEEYGFAMRHWSLPEIAEIFSAFDFALYMTDGTPTPDWKPEMYDKGYFLVGTRNQEAA